MNPSHTRIHPEPAERVSSLCSACNDTGWAPSTSGVGVVRCECRSGSVPMNSGEFETRASIAGYLRLRQGRSGLAFEPDELAFLDAAQDAVGQAGAVSLDDLLRRLGWWSDDIKKRRNAERRVKAVVECLRDLHWIDVGAARNAKRGPADEAYERSLHGYYWMTSAEEFFDTWGPYLAQCITGFRRFHAASRRHGGQARLLLKKLGHPSLFDQLHSEKEPAA